MIRERHRIPPEFSMPQENRRFAFWQGLRPALHFALLTAWPSGSPSIRSSRPEKQSAQSPVAWVPPSKFVSPLEQTGLFRFLQGHVEGLLDAFRKVGQFLNLDAEARSLHRPERAVISLAP